MKNRIQAYTIITAIERTIRRAPIAWSLPNLITAYYLNELGKSVSSTLYMKGYKLDNARRDRNQPMYGAMLEIVFNIFRETLSHENLFLA